MLTAPFCHFAAADPSNTGSTRGNHVAHSVVLGTFNMADQGDGAMPDLSRVSLGIDLELNIFFYPSLYTSLMIFICYLA